MVDLRELLERWPYDPEDDARLVRGLDGREIMQVRLSLGIEQYELEGRPDGQRPYGKESVLAHHQERLTKAEAKGEGAAFALKAKDCAELFEEDTLYYYRYLHLFQLKDWRRTSRDTDRNLTLFDFVQRHAESEEDREYLEKWRPYVLRMNGVAKAMIELGNGRCAHAMTAVQAAVTKIKALPEIEDETFKFERQRSLTVLHELASQIEKIQPVSELERLEQELRQAVEVQAFERAAELRDRLRALRQKDARPPAS
jgi:hypothetical protein